MDLNVYLLDKIKSYGVGQRSLDDDLFKMDKPPLRLGIYDEDDENLCHEIVKSTCQIPGCKYTTDSLLEFENHYNASHRYSCSQCKKVLPSPHLLDLHIQETHDSFFAVLSTKKPSYCCYIEDCKDKFLNTEERLSHCVKIHKIPKDFRFDQKTKVPKTNINCSKNKKTNNMEVDNEHKFCFSNSKQKGFVKYTGKKFTRENVDASEPSTTTNMDNAMEDLKNSLPD